MPKLTIEQAFAKLGLTRQDMDAQLGAIPDSTPDVWKKRTETFHALLKKQHRKIMLECHPDINPTPEALARAQEINALMDELAKIEVGPVPQAAPPPMMMHPGMPVMRVVIIHSGFGGWNSVTNSTTTSAFTGGGGWPW